MKSKIYKNPMILFRGSDVSKNWYHELQSNYNKIDEIQDKIDSLQLKIITLRDRLTDQIQIIFHDTKENYYLNLKRDIFNERIEKLKNSLSKITIIDLKKAVEEYYSLLKEREELKKHYESEFESIYNHEREILKKNINNEEILKSIIFLNKSIYDKMDKFLDLPTASHSSKLRKLDFILIKMLIRASMKTSPFSYFTKTGIVSHDLSIEKSQTAYVELNHGVLLEIIHNFLRNDQKSLEALPVKIDTFGVRDSKVYYVSQMSVKQSQKIFETSDKFVEFSLDSDVIKYLESNKEKIITYKDFYNELQKINAYNGNEFVLFKKLVNLKLFKQVVDIHDERGLLRVIIDFLKKHNIGDEIIPKLIKLDAEVEGFRVNSHKDRIKNWNNIRDLLRELSDNEVSIGNEILYEDITFKETKPNLLKDKIDEEYLKAMADFILLFDVNIRVQYELAALFYNKYGNEEIYLGNSTMLNEVFFSTIHNFYTYYRDQYYCYKDAIAEEVHLLDKLKLEFLNEFTDYVNNTSLDQIDIKPIILKYCNLIPSKVKKNSKISYSLFVQDTGGSEVVVNDVYDGQEKFIARFKDFFEKHQQTEEYSQYINDAFNNKNFYEVSETFGFNGGLHKLKNHKSVNLNIGYQRFVNRDNETLTNFSVKYDPLTKKLDFLDSNKESFNIIYKSSLVPIFLPGILSIMLYMFQSGRFNFNVPPLFKGNFVVPRLSFNNMIISRKKWNIDISELNLLLSEGSDKASIKYQKVLDYFKKLGMPLKFFLKHYRDGKELSVEKPMFFDLKSPLLFKFFVNELGSAIEKNKKVYFEEVLPEIDYELNEYIFEYTFE